MPSLYSINKHLCHIVGTHQVSWRNSRLISCWLLTVTSNPRKGRKLLRIYYCPTSYIVTCTCILIVYDETKVLYVYLSRTLWHHQSESKQLTGNSTFIQIIGFTSINYAPVVIRYPRWTSSRTWYTWLYMCVCYQTMHMYHSSWSDYYEYMILFM